MFTPLSLFIGLRYTRARKRSALVSFVSVVSMLGIALGVLSMIIVLSVINGSTTIMRNETLKSVPHVVVSSAAGLTDWPALVSTAMDHPRVIAAAPFVEGEAWIRYQGQDRFIRLRGVDPQLEAAVSEAGGSQLTSSLKSLGEMHNGLLIGARLAAELGIYRSESVSITSLGSLLGRRLAEARSFSVLGTADFGFYGNEDIAVISIDSAQRLLGTAATVQLRLRVDDVFNAGNIAAAVFDGVGSEILNIVPWTESQQTLFDALRMEKILTGFMLLMIVIIGAVNIVSTLVMVVADKGSDIAILRTMGAGKGMVMTIFMVQGFVAGLLGTVTGMVLGVLGALNLNSLSRAFESLINRVFVPDSIYMISYLQSELQLQDVVTIGLAALLISLLATLYPAWRASRVQPAEVLRYE
ncbi:MAG: lipoprotein-releasing ABC transporter permease subunit [Pseudohongiellaceae bacterium]